MKLLIAVRSCQRDLEAGLHDKIRGTWGKEAKALGIDTRFFLASKFQKYQSDEVHLQCLDSVQGLPFKTREICKWATGKQIENIFLCYTTTAVDPAAVRSSIDGHDYIGKFQSGLGLRYPFVSDKDGYILSRRAFTEIAYIYPMDLPADVGIGQHLGELKAVGEITTTDIK